MSAYICPHVSIIIRNKLYRLRKFDFNMPGGPFVRYCQLHLYIRNSYPLYYTNIYINSINSIKIEDFISVPTSKCILYILSSLNICFKNICFRFQYIFSIVQFITQTHKKIIWDPNLWIRCIFLRATFANVPRKIHGVNLYTYRIKHFMENQNMQKKMGPFKIAKLFPSLPPGDGVWSLVYCH